MRIKGITSIRSKLLLIYGILSLTVMGLLTFSVYTFARNSLTKQINSQLSQNLDSAKAVVQSSMEAAVKNNNKIRILEQYSFLKKYYDDLNKGKLNNSERIGLVRKKLPALKNFINQHSRGELMVIDLEGTLIYSENELNSGKRSWENTDADGKYYILDITSKARLLQRGKIDYTLHYNNTGKGGKEGKMDLFFYFEPLKWIIINSISLQASRDLVNPEDFRRELLRIKTGNRGSIEIFTSEFVQTLHTEHLFEGSIMDTPVHKKMFKRKEGRIEAYETGTDDVSPRKRFYLFDYIPWLDSIIAVGVDENEILKPARDLALISIIFAAVFLGLIIWLTFILSNRMVVSHIITLDKVVEEFSNKKFSSRAVINTNDEIAHLSRNFNSMAESIEEYNLHMEDLVRARTAEIEKLLNQQYGDYYLTANLLNPLVNNVNGSASVDLQVYIEQYKKFEFNSKPEEIGGDICVSREVKLMKEEWILFANADAMGKSIQGAGGAIVFGLLFNAYLYYFNEKQSPENCLKEICRVMQERFLGFDGTMFVSAVIGLVNKKSGKLLYVNLGHQFSVLYRPKNKSAEYIDDADTIDWKIGSNTEAPLIKSLLLEDGQSFIIGSDGKDDLKIGSGKDGDEQIDISEERFLRQVETTNADLAMLVIEIKSSGKLTDDISIMKITKKDDVG